MARLRKTFSGVGGIALALTIGACSSSTPTITDINADAAPAAITAIPVFVSPLDEFLGQSVWTNQEEHQRAVDQFTVRREELIAQCMSDAGFTYQPDLNSTSFTIGTAAFQDIQPENWEWVSQYGFGIASGHRFRTGGPIGERDDDPNREYVASLSETAREAFALALNGPEDFSSPQGPSEAEWDEWMKTRGCTGQAIVKAMRENPLFLQREDEWIPLFQARDAMEVGIREHPEMVALDQEWSHCMADSGQLGLADPSAARSPFWMEFYTTDFEIRSQLEDGTLDEAGAAALRADLQAREVEIALIDFDCRAATNYEARVNGIRFSVETQFVADNRALLEDFRNAAELVG